MIFNLLARAFRQKAPEYLRFAPLPPEDPVLCANCGRPHDEHHRLGACPHPDGSGFMLGQHFKRRRNLLVESDLSVFEKEIRVLEELDKATGEFADDLEEIGKEE